MMSASPEPLNQLTVLCVELTCAFHDGGIVLLRLGRKIAHGGRLDLWPLARVRVRRLRRTCWEHGGQESCCWYGGGGLAFEPSVLSAASWIHGTRKAPRRVLRLDRVRV